jgi:hypothetical protein
MMIRRCFILTLFLALPLTIVAWLMLPQQGAYAAPAEPTQVTIIAPNYARTGEPITIRLVANQAQNLAGFQSLIAFDQHSLRLLSAEVAKDLQRGGREVLALGPVLREGAVVVGAATCPAATCHSRRNQQAATHTPGLNGQVELATITLYTQTPGRYELRLDGVTLVDPQGNSLITTLTNTVLEVVAR